MAVKLIVIVLLLIIVGSLGSALIFLVTDKGEGNRTVKALTWRIGLSFLAFALLMISYLAGLIRPHGL
jgi:small neutral amino acid transporter SnatA (MarC family)